MTEAPDFAMPVQAWRAWRVAERKGRLHLHSVLQKTLWPEGEPLFAGCMRGRSLLVRRLSRRWDHDAPERRCECGIYGASIERACFYLTSTPRSGLGLVFGRVFLWGTVIECEHGFRASAAYPAHIYVPADAHNFSEDGWSEIAIGLQHYRVPVEPLIVRGRDAVAAIREKSIAA